MLENSREPIALHWPVMELAPVPGRPIFPVMSARLMIACAVRVASCPWLTPMVHQKDIRRPPARVRENFSSSPAPSPDAPPPPAPA